MCNILRNRVVLVTGAASGIGEAMVRKFLSEGASVAFTDIKHARGTEMNAELTKGFPGKCIFIPGNHISEEDNIKAITVTVERFGGLDTLCNNAGIIAYGTTEDIPISKIKSLFDTNLLGPYLMVQAALPAMCSRARVDDPASILFTASVQSLIARPRYAAYSASKHGVAGLVGSLARELGPKHIRVNAVCPGPVDTPLFHEGTRNLGKTTEEIRQLYRKEMPLGRFIYPEEIAEAALFLISKRSAAITGTLLPVDGGISAH